MYTCNVIVSQAKLLVVSNNVFYYYFLFFSFCCVITADRRQSLFPAFFSSTLRDVGPSIRTIHENSTVLMGQQQPSGAAGNSPATDHNSSKALEMDISDAACNKDLVLLLMSKQENNLGSLLVETASADLESGNYKNIPERTVKRADHL